VGLAEVAYQRNELDTALQHVIKGIALCRQFVYTPPMAAGLLTLAWIRQASGDPAGALDAIGEAMQAAPIPAGLLNLVPAQRARLLLGQGDLAAADWTQEGGLGADDEPDYPNEPGYLLLAGCCSPRAGPTGPSRCWTGCTRRRSARTVSAA
jgi:LuxR family maltose regulon positive regulatory protein